jgi:chromosome segregation ATPase
MSSPATNESEEEDTPQTILRDLTDIFDPTEEEKMVERVLDRREQLSRGFGSREQQAQVYIQELTDEVNEVEQRINDNNEVEDIKARVAALQAECDSVQQSIGDLARQRLKFEAQARDAANAREMIARGAEQLRALNEETAPKTKSMLGFYAMLSHIKWDYESENVAGFVSHPDKPMREFDIDPSKHSDFDVTNHLWNLIEQQHC